MTHTLTLEVPDQIYRSILEKASESGKPIEEIVLDRLAKEMADDTFEKLIGSLDADVSDWADNHDKYIGLLPKIDNNITPDRPTRSS
jgi:hypothetical protein